MRLTKRQFAGLQLGALGALGLIATHARADWTLLPESRHHLFQSYSFFIEQNNIVAFRGQGRYWAAVAVTLPIVGNNDSPFHPQVLFHLSGNDAMHVNDGGGVFTETLDTRIGIFFEFATPEFWELRYSLGFQHESGHTVDGTDDPNLDPLNLGDNVFRFRIMRDFGRLLRAGLTIIPVEHAIPDNLASGMNEFIEYFPLGSKEDTHSPSPFIAAGLGNGFSFSGASTFHAQAGFAIGSHFQEQHTHDARFVVGYYRGADPRAKYSQFEGKRTEFGYLGLMFNL